MNSLIIIFKKTLRYTSICCHSKYLPGVIEWNELVIERNASSKKVRMHINTLFQKKKLTCVFDEPRWNRWNQEMPEQKPEVWGKEKLVEILKIVWCAKKGILEWETQSCFDVFSKKNKKKKKIFDAIFTKRLQQKRRTRLSLLGLRKRAIGSFRGRMDLKSCPQRRPRAYR